MSAFSHAIAEGDGISVIAAVEDADAARAAQTQRAEALVVVRDPAAVRGATALPCLWRAVAPRGAAGSRTPTRASARCVWAARAASASSTAAITEMPSPSAIA